MLGVLEPEAVGDLAHRVVGVEKLVFGLVDDKMMDVLLRSHACFFFQEVAEVRA